MNTGAKSLRDGGDQMADWAERWDRGGRGRGDLHGARGRRRRADPPLDGELARRLGRIGYTSAATVNLAYRESDFPQIPHSFGFVVPVIEGRRIIAGSFSSLKFAGRAPQDAS